MTPRQSKLLKAIIDEFIQSSGAVGSVNLATKYRLGVSPATIRNEMAELVKQGYLAKPHSSSGRIPTNLGLKFFIDRLLDDLENPDVQAAIRIREDIFQNRFNTDLLIYTALNHLAEQTQNLSLLSLENRVYYAGFTYLLGRTELTDRKQLQDIFHILEDNKLLRNIFLRYRGERKIRILIGEDTGHGTFTTNTVIFAPVKLHNQNEGYMALIGPNSMNYARNIPLLEYIADNLNQVVNGW